MPSSTGLRTGAWGIGLAPGVCVAGVVPSFTDVNIILYHELANMKLKMVTKVCRSTRTRPAEETPADIVRFMEHFEKNALVARINVLYDVVFGASRTTSRPGSRVLCRRQPRLTRSWKSEHRRYGLCSARKTSCPKTTRWVVRAPFAAEIGTVFHVVGEYGVSMLRKQ